MRILLIADVHNRPKTSKKDHDSTLAGIKKAIDTLDYDLIVFMGDTVHGPDFKEMPNEPYEPYLREVLDLTNSKPFAYIFGNHDDECDTTKEQILDIISTYPNSVVNGKNYVVNMQNETLLFIDSGTYYPTDESLYDIVHQDTIDWAKDNIKGQKAILFQHIIVPDIFDIIDQYKFFVPFLAHGDGKWVKFKKGITYSGKMKERPCPPAINSGEFDQLNPYLKAMCFGHDHVNDFELDLNGVRIIQCAGSGSNCYDKKNPSSVKILDTKTLKTEQIYI